GPEVERIDQHGDVVGCVDEAEPLGIAGLAARADVDRDAAAPGAEAQRILIHRLQVRSAAVEQDEAATRAAMVAIGDSDAVRGVDRALDHPESGRRSIVPSWSGRAPCTRP